LIDTAREIANIFVEQGIDSVACDAIEGYNPSHDMCGYLVQFAVRRATALRGPIEWYDFSLIDNPAEFPVEKRAQSIGVRLDTAAFNRKLEAARNYPELKAEYESAIQKFGMESFAIEWLQRTTLQIPDCDPFLTTAPYYETYGQGRVSVNLYSEVIRYREHLRPLQKMLYDMS